MKNKIYLSVALTCTLGFPFLTSCDSNPQDSDEEITLLSSRGYDTDQLNNNPNEVAVFPISLFSGERIQLDLPEDTTEEIQASNLDVTVRTSAQIVLDNLRFSYSRTSSDFRDINNDTTDQAVITRSSEHSVTATEFEERFDNLLQTGGSGPGSLADALIIDQSSADDFAQFSDAELVTILAALETLGFRARINPQSKNFEFLNNHKYELQATSTNAILVNTNMITGTVTEVRTWQQFVFEAQQEGNEEDEVETDTLNRYRLIFGPGRSEVERTGTFSLQLNSLTGE